MLNWTAYDKFNWAGSEQCKMNSAEKDAFDSLGADILQLDAVTRAQSWGSVSSPGRNAAVIRVHDGVPHRFKRNTSIGLKIFNLKDGEVMRRKISKFHNEQRAKFPGLPHALIQNVFRCETISNQGKERGYIIQQWTNGEILEDKMRTGIGPKDMWRILDDLFLELLIPLWGVGSSWWDVRASNYVFTPDRRLVMIDSDTLGGYADEIVETPFVFTKRNNGTRTAIRRYSTWVLKFADQFAASGKKKEMNLTVRQLINHHLEPVFCSPYPLEKGWRNQASKAYLNFRAALQEVFRPKGEPSGSAQQKTELSKTSRGMRTILI